MADKPSATSIKFDDLIARDKKSLVKNNQDIYQRFINLKAIDLTSRLGQFAWRQLTPSTIPLPVIFRHHHREEYLCVQMINIHLLSKFRPEIIAYCMNQTPIHYFSITKHEAKLLHYINKFHSNGYLSNNNQLNYSRLDLAYITPYIPFIQFHHFVYSHSQFIPNNPSWPPLQDNKISTKRKKEDTNNNCSLKRINSSSSNQRETTKSYCQSINFHGKEILSYITTSSANINETISCVSINDIVSIYFPCTTSSKFIELCKSKDIVRYKPDKSTKSDLSLRLIDIRQLEQYWNFFHEQLLTNVQSTSSPVHVKNIEIGQDSHSISIENNTITANITEEAPENPSINVELSSENQLNNNNETKNSSSHLDPIAEIDNQSIKRSVDQQIDSTTQKQTEDLVTIKNKSLKTSRRRRRKRFLTLRRRKQNKPKKISNDNIQSWINKYSIESVSIILSRTNLPND